MPASSSLLMFLVLASEQSHKYASEAGTNTLRSDENSSCAILLQCVVAVDVIHFKGPHTVHREYNISPHRRSWCGSDFLFTSDGVYDPARLKLFVEKQLHPHSRTRAHTHKILQPAGLACSRQVAYIIHSLDCTALAASFLLACSTFASPIRIDAFPYSRVSSGSCLVGLLSCRQ